VKIEVTADDIKNGDKRTCVSCPVALALGRALGSYAFAGPISLFPYSGSTLRIDTPDEVIQFMTNFDAGLPVQPFSFTIPDALLENKEAR